MKLLFLLLLFSCSSLNNHPVVLPPGQEFLTRPYGKVHRSCLNNFGSKLLGIIDRSVSEGLACLNKLNTPGSRKNFAKLDALFKSGKLTYICHEKNWDWVSSIAHGTLDKSFDLPELGAYHPYISIKPDMVLIDSSYKGKAEHPDFVKEVIFHEYFHDIGYSHNRTPEYAYACEACCFYSDGARELACKICDGDYGTIADARYLKRFRKWAEVSRFKKSLRYRILVRSALFQAKGKHNLLPALSHPEGAKDPVLKGLFAEGERRGFPLNDEAKAIIRTPVQVPQDLATLVKDVVNAEKFMYLDRNIRRGKDVILKLNVGPLAKHLKVKDGQEVATLLLDTVLYDLDFLRNYYYRKKEAPALAKKWQEVSSLLPKTSP